MQDGRNLDRTQWVYRTAGTARDRLIPLVLFVSWLGFVLFLASTHAIYRDETRALSMALQGENAFAMVEGIRGEGPAVWYLLLRGAYALVARPEVLQVVALLVAAAAARGKRCIRRTWW